MTTPKDLTRIAGICGFILFTSLFFATGEPTKSIQDFKPSYKENMSNSGSSKFEEFLDKKTNSYSNYKYGFAIRFPMNWTINKGVSEHTIIKGIEADSLITVSVNVIELNFKKNEEIKSAWDLYDNTRLQYEALLKSKGKSEANTNFENFDMKKIHLFNFEAIQTQMEYNIKQVDFEYINKNIGISV